MSWMIRQSVLVVVGLLVAIALVAAIFLVVSDKDVFDLQCSLSDKSGAHHYAFHLEIPKYFGRYHITMVGRHTHDLDVVRLDKTKIYATLDQKLSDWPDKADKMSFDFNRVTGDAQIDYLHRPTDPEHPLPAGFLLILDEFSQTGTCIKAKPAF
jgi:hypothetical protein